MVAGACGQSTWNLETERSTVEGQPSLQSEILSEKTKRVS